MRQSVEPIEVSVELRTCGPWSSAYAAHYSCPQQEYRLADKMHTELADPVATVVADYVTHPERLQVKSEYAPRVYATPYFAVRVDVPKEHLQEGADIQTMLERIETGVQALIVGSAKHFDLPPPPATTFWFRADTWYMRERTLQAHQA